ncbi:MAG: flagellar basal body-associated FliL family protein [Proteobacteria bacterium]|uniref:Flagellar protein FliL n=1 Tax=Candidatus Avisuccinivibrio stercorigallinarum TaxID=2840704 RepID=A0A9D9DA04_9GAMM|nr:flagellar basal body-associated FliL family protein [Candidatus Avisuccinivibrio stercorigallinarum]
MSDDVENSGSGRKKGRLRKWLLIALAAVIVLGGASYTGIAYLNNLPPFEPSGPTPEEIAAERVAQEQAMQQDLTERFVTFPQAFTFNVQDGTRMHMMQIEVALMVIGPQNEELAKQHSSLIQAVISEVTARQTYASLVNQTGRQRLKRLLLEAIRSKMSGVVQRPVVEQVLFTNFVMQ